MGIRIYRRKAIALAETSAFIFSVLILLAYLRTAGWYRYFFEAFLLALIFLPHSLRNIFEILQEHPRFPRRYSFFVAAAFCGLLSLVQFYQLNFSSWVADHYKSTATADLTRYFATYPPQKSTFVYNAPELVPFLPSRNYYQYIEPTETTSYGKEQLSLLSQGVPDEVFVSPEAYDKNKSLFDAYVQRDTVGSYLLLDKRNASSTL